MKKHFKKFLLFIYKLYLGIRRLEEKKKDIERAACWTDLILHVSNVMQTFEKLLNFREKDSKCKGSM